jgi:RNA polymerase sigma factor (sigma-70 family)
MSSTLLLDSEVESPEDLLARIVRQDSAAERAVFDAYYARLLRMALRRQAPHLRPRFCADDVAQSAMRTFFAHARKGEYSLPPGGDLWQLLAKITRRKLTKHVRVHRAQRRTVDREERGDLGEWFDVPDAATNGPGERAAILEELHVILEPLRKEYRQMVMLRLAGYPIADIAAELQCCDRTVFRALERFAELAAERQTLLSAIK